MSIELMNAVWRSAKYDKTALLVLLALADQANDHGSCWPSVTTIAARARCTERHVRTILRDLEKDGALSVEHRPGTSSVYRINVPSLTTTPELQFRPEDSSPRNSGSGLPRNPSSGEGGTPVPGTPEPQFRQTTNNHQENHQMNRDELATVAESRNTGTLMAEWLEHSTPRPPGRVIGQVANEVKAMLDEGQPYDDVRNGLAAWARKGLHPSTLASVVHETRTHRPEKKIAGIDWDAALARAAERDRNAS